jgi:hypothetical protein
MEAYEKAQEQFKREKQAYWAMRDRLMKDYYGLWVAEYVFAHRLDSKIKFFEFAKWLPDILILSTILLYPKQGY